MEKLKCILQKMFKKEESSSSFVLFNFVIQPACGGLIRVTLPLIPNQNYASHEKIIFPQRGVCSGERGSFVHAKKWKDSSVKRQTVQGVP